jgi:hypothetical protein
MLPSPIASSGMASSVEVGAGAGVAVLSAASSVESPPQAASTTANNNIKRNQITRFMFFPPIRKMIN